MLLPALITGAVGLTLWLSACAPNEPFDPLSVENAPPVMRMSVSPVDPDQGLRPTSYFERKFSWYGSDQDGWVQEYYVSVRTEFDQPEPWITTDRTDTTMSFVTDENGDAQAIFYLVCRDDRGALSDTLVKTIPFHNSPPVIEFQSDFEPLRNLQREDQGDGTYTYWNWGTGYFRFFAQDPDGAATMDPFYQYTYADTEPEVAYFDYEAEADPYTTWVKVPFDSSDDIKEFELFITDLDPGPMKLTVKLVDEAGSEDREIYEWEVRAPQSNILYIKDNTSSIGKNLYYEFLNTRFGGGSVDPLVAGDWDLYDFWFGFPEHPFILLETMRMFDAVMWTDGGVTSETLARAARTGGVLDAYLSPTDGSSPGQLLLISKALIGDGIPAAFVQNVFGLNPSGNNEPLLTLWEGKQALGGYPDIPVVTSATRAARGVGLKLLPEEQMADSPFGLTEPLYTMEYCEDRRVSCYNSRPTLEPMVGVRRPSRDSNEDARVVGISFQLEYFIRAEALDALTWILDDEMGVTAP